MIKMKIKDLIKAKSALCKLVSQDVPVYWAIHIAKLVDAVDPYLSDKIDPYLNDRAVEQEVEIAPIVLPMGLGIMLSAADVKALSQIVVFSAGGDADVCDS